MKETGIKKIGILGAMDEEVALLKASLSNLKETTWKHLTFYEGHLNDVEVVLVKCGIGKVAAALATTVLIEQYAPDAVVNTGSAGGFDKSLNIGDLVIATHVIHHDVDLTHFGYTLGQCAGMPEDYRCDNTLIEAAKTATSELENIQSTSGLICTGDSFIGTDEAVEALRENFPEMKAVEMEGAAIAQTCHMLDVPFLVIRSLSDIAGKTSTVSFKEYLDTAAKHSAQLVMAMIKALA
ncbi:5'-methylthioadenosine/S-adenosylhomocysteine nucleosidase [Alteromonas sp. 38]|uniref:5'-methylthioadenosine/adenosylhomocysteine nucleosidase n=1 Tax=unclassified Alteromonas TaxID=2614992 RepID=UPI0012F14E03|nr:MULTISPECIES: 5'-methylthioadenosine/adenosylhomocysteine nucleosidase [unclassified Alteromonas]CAD5261606.1 5'-methylthioadenosine/S-adenosylhomocysteine nucleosidase [Alteromonas sp. 154]VXC27736.1 5'-methylthioadenosine/S-adenosylhomocysteine nucleosidase [Alteromonas sp. 38]